MEDINYDMDYSNSVGGTFIRLMKTLVKWILIIAIGYSIYKYISSREILNLKNIKKEESEIKPYSRNAKAIYPDVSLELLADSNLVVNKRELEMLLKNNEFMKTHFSSRRIIDQTGREWFIIDYAPQNIALTVLIVAISSVVILLILYSIPIIIHLLRN